MQTFEKVCAIISHQLGLDASFEFSKDTTWDELGADSLDLVEIVMAIEDDFDIEIPDDAISAMHNMGDLVAFIDVER